MGPNDLNVDDGQLQGAHDWELLSDSASISGDTLTVKLTADNGSADWTYADAMRLQYIPSGGTLIVIR